MRRAVDVHLAAVHREGAAAQNGRKAGTTVMSMYLDTQHLCEDRCVLRRMRPRVGDESDDRLQVAVAAYCTQSPPCS